MGLQSKAKEMVMLAEKMRQKLLSGSTSQAGGPNDEEMGSKQEMQDWLLSVGIVSPVTKESAGALYHQQLCRQVFSNAHCIYFLSFFIFVFAVLLLPPIFFFLATEFRNMLGVRETRINAWFVVGSKIAAVHPQMIFCHFSLKK